MPLLTRWFIKLSLAYLVAALLMGVALGGRAVLDLPAALSALSPVYFHLFMVGWVTQLIFGMVYWMFPKHSREKPHGSEGLAWTVFGLLNAGLILRAVTEPLHALEPGIAWGWLLGGPQRLLALSAVFQWLAGLGFVLNTWARVKER